jgi:hypothetical protein
LNLPALQPSTDISSFLGDSRWRDRFDDEILAAANSLANCSTVLTGSIERNSWPSGIYASPDGRADLKSIRLTGLI